MTAKRATIAAEPHSASQATDVARASSVAASDHGRPVSGPLEAVPSRHRPDGPLYGVQWYVLYTAPQAEVKAARGLARNGYAVFLPIARHTKRIRRRFAKQSTMVTVERAAFPRYVFVGLAPRQGWYDVRLTAGVEAVVSRDMVPIRVPADTIEGLIIAEDMGMFDTGNEAQIRLEIGQAVRIVSGPMEGYTATVSKAPRKSGPVIVVLDGKPVHVPLDQIRTVA